MTSRDQRPERSARGPSPPLLGRWLLRLRRLGGRPDEVESDLRELFEDRRQMRGRWYAARRYLTDVASVLLQSSKRTSRYRADGRLVSLLAHRSGPGRAEPSARARFGARTIDGLLLDLRFAVRTFRRHTAAVSITVAGLALAIGITTVAFGFVSLVFLPPLDSMGPDPASVVELSRVRETGTSPTLRSYSHYLRLRESVRSVALEAYFREGAPLGDAGLMDVRVTLVSGGFFEMLGASAALGRVLSPGDDRPGAAPATVINHTFWRRHFGADPTIVGKTVRLMGTPFTVVGVVEEGFIGPSGGADPPALWAPLANWEPVWNLEATPIVWIVGRLAEGVTLEQAGAEVAAVDTELRAEEAADGQQLSAAVLAPPYDRASDPTSAWVVGSIAVVLVLILLLACTNVANLLLAGAIVRRREVGVRLALGAGRQRIVRQLLTESLLVGTLAGGLGLLLAVWLLPVVAAFVELPATFDPVPDARVYGFVVAATLLAGVLAGLAPARFGMRSDIAAPLKGDSPATGRSGRPGRTRSLLVGAQACASIVLLILAALFTRTVVHVAGADVGSDVDRLLTVAPRFDAAGYDAARASSYWQQALQRVGDLPGVERASLATNPPFLGRGYRGLRPTYRGRVYDIHRNWVASDYFETAGIQILRGRTFTAAEVAANAPVVVISERVARWLWGDEEPIGDTLSRIAADMPGEEGQARVVGVAGDAVDRLEDPTIAATLYHPLAGESVARASLVVRGHGDAKDIVGPVFEAVRALDPEVLPVAQTVRDGIRDARMPLRLFAASAAALGAVALALAVIGIFGVTAFTVAQRTEEIGVRVAIGATARDVARLMLADNLRPVAIGLAVGFLAAIAGGRVLSAVLFGISPHDPGSILAAVLILLGAATAAALLPTRRATRIDPAIVLRRH